MTNIHCKQFFFFLITLHLAGFIVTRDSTREAVSPDENFRGGQYRLGKSLVYTNNCSPETIAIVDNVKTFRTCSSKVYLYREKEITTFM